MALAEQLAAKTQQAAAAAAAAPGPADEGSFSRDDLAAAAAISTLAHSKVANQIGTQISVLGWDTCYVHPENKTDVPRPNMKVASA